MPRTVDQIVDAVAKAAGITSEYFLDSSNRTHDIRLARHVACWMIRRETHLSFRKIAQVFGSRDHQIVLHGFNRTSVGLLKSDPEITRLVLRAQQGEA